MQKKWAEWMVVINTGILIPFEVYEVVHRPTLLRALILILNILITVYLAQLIARSSKYPRIS